MNDEIRFCKNCEFFLKTPHTRIGECKAEYNEETHCKAIVYENSDATFCKEFLIKKEVEENGK